MSCGQATHHLNCWHQLVSVDGPWLVVAGQDVRLTTVITGGFLALAIGWRTRSPVRAFAGAMAWLCLYEVFFLVTTTVLLGWPWLSTFWETFAILGYVLWAWALGVRPNPLLLSAFLVSWAAWTVAGLHANWPTDERHFRLGDEIANVATKGILAIAYLAGTRAPRRSETFVSASANPGLLRQIARQAGQTLRELRPGSEAVRP